MSSPIYERDVPAEKRRAYIVVRAKVSGDSALVAHWRRELSDYVKRGLRAQTQLAGVTGQQFLALDHVDPAQYPALPFDWMPKYPYVPSIPSLTGQIIDNFRQFLASLNEADIQDLGRNLNKLVKTLNRKIDQVPVTELSAEAEGLLKDARAAIQQVEKMIAAAPVDQAVENISNAAGRIDQLVADPAISQTLRHVARASGRLDGLLANPVKQTADNAAALTARLRKIAETGQIDRLVSHLDRTVERLDALIGDNQYDVRVIIQNLQVTADNLRNLSETAKRYPAGLFFGGPPEKIDLPWKETK
jgi:phospholipid/cholesterol/gamma-HCH transport system substrate-binding protein/paraquat-inducible protein B